MSDQAFERAVSDKLRAMAPAVWVYHPPDDQRARQWKPGDFIYGATLKDGTISYPGWGVIECKEVTGAASFPLSRWSPQQRGHAQAVTAAGGRYWLLVRFQPAGAVVAFKVTPYIATKAQGSLSPVEGTVLSEGRSFSLKPLFA